MCICRANVFTLLRIRKLSQGSVFDIFGIDLRISSSSMYVTASIFRKKKKKKKKEDNIRARKRGHTRARIACIDLATHRSFYLAYVCARINTNTTTQKSWGILARESILVHMKCTRSILWPRAKHTEESYKHFIPVGHWALRWMENGSFDSSVER